MNYTLLKNWASQTLSVAEVETQQEFIEYCIFSANEISHSNGTSRENDDEEITKAAIQAWNEKN